MSLNCLPRPVLRKVHVLDCLVVLSWQMTTYYYLLICSKHASRDSVWRRPLDIVRKIGPDVRGTDVQFGQFV